MRLPTPTTAPRAPEHLSFARLVVCLTMVLSAASAHAQTVKAGGALASISAGGAVTENSTDFYVAGGIGYRLNDTIGFGMELTSIALHPEIETVSDALLPIVRYSDAKGRATVFTTNLRLELPISSRRIIPFAVGGGGVANVSQSAMLTITPPPLGGFVPVDVDARYLGFMGRDGGSIGRFGVGVGYRF
jgi:hypothetical protein